MECNCLPKEKWIEKWVDRKIQGAVDCFSHSSSLGLYYNIATTCSELTDSERGVFQEIVLGNFVSWMETCTSSSSLSLSWGCGHVYCVKKCVPKTCAALLASSLTFKQVEASYNELKSW